MVFVKYVILDVQNVLVQLEIVLHVQLIDFYLTEHVGIIALVYLLITNVLVNALQDISK